MKTIILLSVIFLTACSFNHKTCKPGADIKSNEDPKITLPTLIGKIKCNF